MGIRCRSLLGILYFLSQAVQLPADHVRAGLGTITQDESGQPFDWSKLMNKVMRIRSQKERPENAYVAVQHRGWWFYIADDDQNSKATFSLLNILFSLQSASEKGEVPPLYATLGVRSWCFLVFVRLERSRAPRVGQRRPSPIERQAPASRCQRISRRRAPSAREDGGSGLASGGSRPMNSLDFASIVCGCSFGAAMIGMVLHVKLPDTHLDAESKNVVNLVLGLIATLAALVLGLLIASARTSMTGSAEN